MIGPDYDHFCALVLKRSGLVLTADKTYLVGSRLDPIALRLGLTGTPALLAALRRDGDERLIQQCVDAMATHESYFFRDGTPFEQLKNNILGPLAAARASRRSLRIWSAACSSGQEAYSIAMLLQEWSVQLTGWSIEIIATDMSEGVLEKARSGIYSHFEVQRGLSSERLIRFFQKRGDSWEVSPALKKMITFKKHNLLDGITGLGVFDLIFCRNVLIYFDRQKKSEILEQIARAMAPDGCLFLGSAETVIGLTKSMDPAPGLRGVYRLNAQAKAA